MSALKDKASLGARLVDRSPLAREIWIVVALVAIIAVSVVTVLVPAIRNEHPNDDDGPAPAHSPAAQHATPPASQH